MAGVLQKLAQSVVVKAVRRGAHKLFSKYLLVTNTTIGFSLAAASDLINQRCEKFSGFRMQWDPVRTRNQCIQGMAFGSAFHFWYIFLDRMLPGYTARVVLKKVFVDQLTMTPVSIVAFLALLGVLEGQHGKEIGLEIRNKGPLLLGAEWTVGPITQLFNFFLLPTRFRVLYDSFVCLSFDAYYIHIKYRHGKSSSDENQINNDVSGDEVTKYHEASDYVTMR